MVFGTNNPVVAAFDALQAYVFGARLVPTGDTLSGSSSLITVVEEAILTGDYKGLEEATKMARERKFGWILEEFSKVGEWWANQGGGTDRASVVGGYLER